MSYSDRLLSHLQRRGYVPAAADAIAKQWRLNPKDRRSVGHLPSGFNSNLVLKSEAPG